MTRQPPECLSGYLYTDGTLIQPHGRGTGKRERCTVTVVYGYCTVRLWQAWDEWRQCGTGPLSGRIVVSLWNNAGLTSLAQGGTVDAAVVADRTLVRLVTAAGQELTWQEADTLHSPGFMPEQCDMPGPLAVGDKWQGLTVTAVVQPTT